MAQLILNHLTKDFGAKGPGEGGPAVSDVSLTLRQQGFLALLGPSGCGKTTVLRMIAGFEQPTDGSIEFGERRLSDAVRVLPPEKRNIAMVFQSYALWPHMTVAENVGYPLKVRRISGEAWRSRVAEALSLVRLTAYADRRPSALSGGQRQRVALARCLV
ncbi:ABC transporter ATP-binding protein, partial [Sinorhizobium medicae]|uniref:ABC transporter ATP-binding protein n=1 Tax=Sinorhizobium medicae TaxID=110321 RepID=UPI003B51DC97